MGIQYRTKIGAPCCFFCVFWYPQFLFPADIFFFLHRKSVSDNSHAWLFIKENESWHRKLILQKKTVLLLLLGLKPATFQSQVQCSKHSAITTPSWHTYIPHTVWYLPHSELPQKMQYWSFCYAQMARRSAGKPYSDQYIHSCFSCKL